MLLAQTPDPASFFQLCVGLGFILSLVVNVVALVRTGRAQKREVTFSGEYQPKGNYATKAELDAVETRISVQVGGVERDVKTLRGEIIANGEVRRQSIEGKVEGVRHELDGKIGLVHEKINKVDKEVGGIKSATDLQNQQLARMEISLQHIARKA